MASDVSLHTNDASVLDCEFHSNRRSYHLALQVVAALVVVLVTHWFIPFAQPRDSDDSLYLLLARDIKYDGGYLFYNEPYISLHFPPGYPWLLSFLVQRENLGLAPLVQSLYLGATISVGAIWATTAFGIRVGWLVFALLSINPAFVSSSAMLASEAPHVLLYLLGFLAWFRFVKTRSVVALLLSGLCLALSVYIRVYGLLLVVFIPMLLVVGFRNHPWRHTLWHIVGFVTCWVLVLGPWTIRNYQVFGYFVPVTIKTGYALYSAWFPPGPNQFGMSASDEVVEEASTIKDPFERNVFYQRAVVKKILAHPGTALTTVVRKYVFYLMPFDWEFFGKYNAAGRLRPSLHFVYVFFLPFALLYLWQNRGQRELWVGYMAPILFGLIMTAITYGIPRFRLCMEPFLTVYAAIYLSRWVSGSPGFRGGLAGIYFLACLGGAYAFELLVQ